MCLWCVCFLRLSGELNSFKSNDKLFWGQKRNAELPQEERAGFAVSGRAHEQRWRYSVVGTPQRCSALGSGVRVSPRPGCVCNSVLVGELHVSRCQSHLHSHTVVMLPYFNLSLIIN